MKNARGRKKNTQKVSILVRTHPNQPNPPSDLKLPMCRLAQPVGPHPRRARHRALLSALTHRSSHPGYTRPEFYQLGRVFFLTVGHAIAKAVRSTAAGTATRLSFNFNRGQARSGFLVSLSFTFRFTLVFLLSFAFVIISQSRYDPMRLLLSLATIRPFSASLSSLLPDEMPNKHTYKMPWYTV